MTVLATLCLHLGRSVGSALRTLTASSWWTGQGQVSFRVEGKSYPTRNLCVANSSCIRPPAGFPTPFPSITIGPNGDPTYPASPSPTKPTTDPTTSTSSTSTCTETETATDVTYFVSFVTESDGSAISTSTYSTASTQVRGCSVTGTTATSTTATGAPSYCSAGCASCNVKRSLPSATPGPAARSSVLATRNPHQVESLVARDIPDSGFGILTLYSDVRESDITIAVPLDQAPVAGSVIEIGVSSSRFTYFDNAEHNILVEGLVGCTSVVVVSRLGAWASHFWEAPSFRDQNNGQGTDPFVLDVLDYMQYVVNLLKVLRGRSLTPQQTRP